MNFFGFFRAFRCSIIYPFFKDVGAGCQIKRSKNSFSILYARTFSFAEFQDVMPCVVLHFFLLQIYFLFSAVSFCFILFDPASDGEAG